jgi:hypothetical protein
VAEDPENDERTGDAPDSGDPSEGGEDQPAGGNAPADEVEETPDDKAADEDAGDENVSEASTREDEAPGDDEYGARRSDVDAMGNDKRREVVGQQYGASRKKKLAIYGGVLAFVAVVVIAFLTVVRGYDDRDIALKDTAPWTQDNASKDAPRDVDFKANGPTDTIPAEDIVNR